jgi:hypothetical protein
VDLAIENGGSFFIAKCESLPGRVSCHFSGFCSTAQGFMTLVILWLI